MNAIPRSLLQLGLFNWAFVAVGELTEMPGYVQMLERLGSFVLVAFIVWYFVKYAIPQQRQDYLAAQTDARQDFIAAITRSQASSDKMAEAVEKLAQATYQHIAQAQTVWQKQDEDRKRLHAAT